MVTGVSTGFKRELELVGVGYRATVAGNQIDLALGFSHNIIFELPGEIKATAIAEKGQNQGSSLSRMISSCWVQ